MTISPQTTARSRELIDELGLAFDILRDAGNTYAHRLGLRFKLPPKLERIYGGLGIDLPASNGEDSLTLPLPARYVVAPDGRVTWAAVHADYTRRPEPEETLDALRALGDG